MKIISSQILRWTGHVKREEQLVKLEWKDTPEGKRSLGSPRIRCRDNIEEDLRTRNMEKADELIMDRAKSGQIVSDDPPLFVMLQREFI